MPMTLEQVKVRIEALFNECIEEESFEDAERYSQALQIIYDVERGTY